ncbi:hypothetical protein F5972_29210 [Microbispora cellulosiformans]|uniref:Uncharacterized protein n=1 Tax=Microbispora cellulosiformans TaxID=2614688 RepID=A0A5J5JUC0_9ACTN|nr:hypothetical protein [Microbispora cellulosiformans]KAA9375042.1 hypothetical protein F5972_29210 [Microbispora cellulosiformans]
MPNLKKVITGLVLSTAVVGGAIALGTTAASAGDGDRDGVADGNRGGTGGIAQGNTGLGNGLFPGFTTGTDNNGVSNGNRGGTGGIAQGNTGLGDGRGFPAFATANPFVDGNNRNNNANNNNHFNNNQFNNGNNWWWDQRGWWGQNLYKDGKDDHSAFGVVAKDVALGFQDKTNRDNNWFHNNWWQNNGWYNNNDRFDRNNWNRLRQ